MSPPARDESRPREGAELLRRSSGRPRLLRLPLRAADFFNHGAFVARVEEEKRFNGDDGIAPEDSENGVGHKEALPDGILQWSRARWCVWRALTWEGYDLFMGCVILVNFALIAFEVDRTAQCYPEWEADIMNCPYQTSLWSPLWYTNTFLLVLYTVEALAQCFVWRRRYFCSKWRLLDFFVVVFGWLSSVGTGVNMAFLRMLRIVRVGRFFRVFLRIRELYMLLAGLASSFKAILFGSMLLGLILVVWAIITVEFVHPVNAGLSYDGCPRCAKAFRSVGDSMLTLFQQIIAGDSWGLVSVPVITEQPLTAFILISIFLSISLATMNLILAVIVEAAAEARERDTEQKIKTRQQECVDMKADLLRICQEMDKDESGYITMNEMLKAWQENPDFRRVIAHLDMSKADLGNIFLLMDTDGTREVRFKDFVDKLYDLRSRDMRLMLMLIGLSQLDHKVSVVASELKAQQDFGNSMLRHQALMIEAVATKMELPIPEGFYSLMDRAATSEGRDDEEMATRRSSWHWNTRASTEAPVIKSALQEAERRHLQQHAEEARADDAPAEAVEAHARDAAIRDDRRRGHAAPPEAVEADVADCDVRWQGRRASPQDPADSETEAGAACGFGDSGAMDVAGFEDSGMDVVGIADSVQAYIARNAAILRRSEERMHALREHTRGLAMEMQSSSDSEDAGGSAAGEAPEAAKPRASQLAVEVEQEHAKALAASGRLLLRNLGLHSTGRQDAGSTRTARSGRTRRGTKGPGSMFEPASSLPPSPPLCDGHVACTAR